jgi:hypothetical protein
MVLSGHRPRILVTGAFASAEEAETMIQYKIYVSQADGSRIIPLTEGYAGGLEDIEWQP